MGAGGSEGTRKCGEFGGQTRQGEPCGRAAGWGTDRPGDGPCQDHGERKAEKVKATKKAFLEAFDQPDAAKISFRQAAQMAGVSESTLWRWRQEDWDFADEVEELRVRRDEMRLELYDDQLFSRVLKGQVAAALQIFWAINTARRVARARGEEPYYDNTNRHHVAVTDQREYVVEAPAAEDLETWLERYHAMRREMLGPGEGASGGREIEARATASP